MQVISVRAVNVDYSQVVESALLKLVEILKVSVQRVAAENHRRRTLNIIS